MAGYQVTQDTLAVVDTVAHQDIMANQVSLDILEYRALAGIAEHRDIQVGIVTGKQQYLS